MARKLVKFGYGIVDKDGLPHWSECCVCQDRDTLETEEVANLNAYAGRKEYRTVALYYQVEGGKRG